MELEDNEKNILSKICIDASKNAGDALKQMINKNVVVDFPSVKLKSVPIVDRIGEQSLIGISKISGDISGNLIISYDLINGLKLLDMMMMQPPDTLKEVTDDAKSAFTEFLNIIGGAFLNTLGDDLKFTVLPNPPSYLSHVSEMDSELYSLVQKTEEDLFVVDTFLKVESEQVGGDLFLIFDENSLNKIMIALKSRRRG
ncbi:MAG: chemotaxis protein CheX [Candidatus Woesearchaeota archaeon]